MLHRSGCLWFFCRGCVRTQCQAHWTMPCMFNVVTSVLPDPDGFMLSPSTGGIDVEFSENQDCSRNTNSLVVQINDCCGDRTGTLSPTVLFDYSYHHPAEYIAVVWSGTNNSNIRVYHPAACMLALSDIICLCSDHQFPLLYHSQSFRSLAYVSVTKR